MKAQLEAAAADSARQRQLSQEKLQLSQQLSQPHPSPQQPAQQPPAQQDSEERQQAPPQTHTAAAAAAAGSSGEAEAAVLKAEAGLPSHVSRRLRMHPYHGAQLVVARLRSSSLRTLATLTL